jgi:hypothetical protein
VYYQPSSLIANPSLLAFIIGRRWGHVCAPES